MPHTLLLADDSVTIQRVIELTFADEDVEVVAVGNGDEAIERLDAAPAESQPPPATVTQPLPSLADAFAALLAAEQGEPTPPVAPSWPVVAAAPAAVSDDLVEAVTRRVLDRLTDHRVVRETVADVVSSIAERLVREEIERIKSSIK